MAYMGLGLEPQPSGLAAFLSGAAQGLNRYTDYGVQQQAIQQRQQALNQQAQQQRDAVNAQHLAILPKLATMDPDQAKFIVDLIKQQRESMGLPTGPLVDYAAKLKPEDASLLQSSPVIGQIAKNPTQAMEKPPIGLFTTLGKDLTQRRAAQDEAQSAAEDQTQPPQVGGLGLSGAFGNTPLNTSLPGPLQSQTPQAPASPIAALESKLAAIDAERNRIAGVVVYNPAMKEAKASRLAELNTQRQSLMAVYSDLMKRVVVPAGASVLTPATGDVVTPGGAGSTEPAPMPQSLGNGMWRFFKKDAQTGKVTSQDQFEPGFSAGQLTHGDAFANLIATKKLPANADRSDPAVASAVANELARMQALAAGQKATQVTVSTARAKEDLPLGKNAQEWLLPDGRFADPSMSEKEARDAGARPYKDAIKRMDQESASRTFLQHLDFLEQNGPKLFPPSTGNSATDIINARLAAAGRRIKGVTDPENAALLNIEVPSAMQSILATAPGARAGQRLLQSFRELTDPFQPYTRESYVEGLHSLRKLAVTAIQQRGRPGEPGPNQTVPSAAAGETPQAGTRTTGSLPQVPTGWKIEKVP